MLVPTPKWGILVNVQEERRRRESGIIARTVATWQYEAQACVLAARPPATGRGTLSRVDGVIFCACAHTNHGSPGIRPHKYCFRIHVIVLVEWGEQAY
eukprot:1176680-Prorocentrum_minimum.AAC.4